MYSSQFPLQALAEQVTDSDLAIGRVYPPLANIQDVSFQIALRVAQIAYMQGLATVIPEPEDKHNLIRSVLYSPDYKSYLPQTYDYPMGHEEEFEDDVEWNSNNWVVLSKYVRTELFISTLREC